MLHCKVIKGADIMQEFIEPGRATVLVGGQFGSEAKGLVAAYVAQSINKNGPLGQMFISTTNAGAQAGHTTILEDGTKFVCYHLPTIGVMTSNARIYLNAGSIIDPDLLLDEVRDVATALGITPGELAERIVIHPNAAVIHTFDRAREAIATTAIGSTRKGVGSALSNKIMRQPGAVAAQHGRLNRHFTVGTLDLNTILAAGGSVTVEVPQGTGLSLNAGRFYPHCTSRDCWVGQGLADAGIHPSYLGDVIMVCRPFPIRVGHIYDEQGRQVGDSGPFYPDSHELDWGKDLPGVTPEITTVTKRVRRIATWSPNQFYEALALNRPTHVFITFTNYFGPEALRKFMLRRASDTNTILRGNPPKMHWSWGPRVDQVGTAQDALEVQPL